MKPFPLLFLLLAYTCPLSAQDWRYVKDKKLYTDLDDAIAHKDDVYNLQLYSRNVRKDKLYSIGKLKHLQYLAIENAGLQSLPNEIFNLPDLRTLSLVQNNFHRLPHGISQLKKLEYLVMYDNQITSIPDWIGTLTNLETLILPRNNIDSISPAITQLQKLKDLNLAGNKIRSLPENIGRLQSLEELGLEDCRLTHLPASITQLSHLTYLGLNNNRLTHLPANIGNLMALRSLSLSENQLNELPTSIKDLTQLTLLVVENNPLNNWRDDIQFPNSITQLEITGKAIHTFPASLHKCLHLEHLSISKTAITDIPSWIGELSQLDWLALNDNKLTAIPAPIDRLQHLSVVLLSGNKLDTIPGAIFLLPELKTLNIGNNPIRHLPSEITRSSSLTSICIMGTQITNDEYKAIHKKTNTQLDIAHDKIVYFEEEGKPCYTDLPGKPVPNVFTRLETDPYFIGAPNAWQTFINVHHKKALAISHSSDSRHTNGFSDANDSVLIRFIVRREGGISNITVLSFKNKATRDEAVRLLKLSCPYWVPSNVEGRNVNAWFEQAFIFKVRKQGDHTDISVRVVTPFPARPRTFTSVLRKTSPSALRSTAP